MEKSRIIVSGEDRELPVSLTSGEVDNYARQLASEVESLTLLDEEKKDWNSAFNKRRKTQNDLVLEVTKKVNTGQEDRLVRCSIIHDYGKKKVEVLRDDTHEVVETRSMTKAEYETAMQLRLEDT
jgi:hypothetical protein